MRQPQQSPQIETGLKKLGPVFLFLTLFCDNSNETEPKSDNSSETEKKEPTVLKDVFRQKRDNSYETEM